MRKSVPWTVSSSRSATRACTSGVVITVSSAAWSGNVSVKSRPSRSRIDGHDARPSYRFHIRSQLDHTKSKFRLLASLRLEPDMGVYRLGHRVLSNVLSSPAGVCKQGLAMSIPPLRAPRDLAAFGAVRAVPAIEQLRRRHRPRVDVRTSLRSSVEPSSIDTSRSERSWRYFVPSLLQLNSNHSLRLPSKRVNH